MKKLNKAHITGIIIIAITTVFLVENNTTIETISGVFTGIGSAFIIGGRFSFKNPHL